MNGGKTRVLIFTLEIWHMIARLPKVLRQAGFEVAALCPPDSFLTATRHLDELFLCRSQRHGEWISQQLATVVEKWKPQFVIAGDDRAVLFIRRLLAAHHSGQLPLPPGMLEILRRSFGNFDWLAEATSKRLTVQCAQRLGIKTPRFACVESVEAAVKQAQSMSWPVALKRSTAWGGSGITFCHNETEVKATFHKYREAGTWVGALKARYLQMRGWGLGPGWLPADHAVTVNEVIHGKPAMTAVAAADGNVLMHVSAQAEHCFPTPHSPSSVVRFIDHPGMAAAAEKMTRHWQVSGLLGFDFMLDAQGEAYLIECNPRPICITTQGQFSGRELCLAWYNHFAGLPAVAPGPLHHEVVAHFPQEWRRDANSPYLSQSCHDVPWDDPELLRKLAMEYR